MNRCSCDRRRPRLGTTRTKPKVAMGVRLAAKSDGVGSDGSGLNVAGSICDGRGRTDTSAPVSIKYRHRVFLSVI